MTKPISSLSAGWSLFWPQLIWTLGFLGIILLVNVGKMIFLTDAVDSFYTMGSISANVYMLIIGIISINFMRYFVEHGATRKNYFIGNVIASLGLSLIIPIFVYLVSLAQKLVANFFTSITLHQPHFEDAVVDTDGNFIGDIIQAILLAPHPPQLNPESNVILSLAFFSLHIFVFYLIGWMIAAAFYRLDVIGGLLFIAIGIAFLGIKDSMIRLALDLPLYQSFTILNAAPERLAWPIVFAITLATIALIRRLTKRAPIKI